MTESSSTAAPVAPKGVDTEKPSAARVYDWFLGGSHNWAVDREFGRRVEQLWPLFKPVAQQNRAFMNRVVAAALDAGIRQFVDLGSGVPTVGNVHEIVRNRIPEGEEGRVVYVDYEPVAAAHSTLILEQEDVTDWTGLVQEDIRNPDAIFAAEETQRLIDWSKPVCLLMIAVLHFVGPDDDPAGLVERYRRKLAPGSWLALTHAGVADDAPPARAKQARDFVAAYKNTSNPLWLRDPEEFLPWFGGWPLLPPGVSSFIDWRPDRKPDSLDAETRPFGRAAVAAHPG